MRYLKLFKEGFDTEDFYKEVDRNEYLQKAGSDVERTDFEKTDRVSLEENLVDCKLRWKIRRGKTAYQRSYFVEDHFYDYLEIWTYPTYSKINEEIFIFKVPDDYFIVYWTTETRKGKGVNSKSKYFICDQVNGLLKLLTDKKIIKTSKKEED
jgi:hypothetical protein